MDDETKVQGKAEDSGSVREIQVLNTVDVEAERSLVRKLDIWLLPYLSFMYFWNAIDRVSQVKPAQIFGVFQLTSCACRAISGTPKQTAWTSI